MIKGIVMDMKKHNIVVLTPNGEFITFKKKVHSYMIGEEISFNEQEQRVPRFSTPSFLKPASLLVACFLCVLLFIYNQPEEKALAYVSVDINPSLELSVTKEFSVIDLQARNDDGKRILKEMRSWKNEHMQDVIRTIVKLSQEDKFLTDDKQVTLTAVAMDKSLDSQLENAMKELKKEYEIKHITVAYQFCTMQTREKAKKAGIGTGVYIKQENEKKNSVTTAAPTSEQEVNKEEGHSQPMSSPSAPSELSSVKEKNYEKQVHKEQKQTEVQSLKQIKENNENQHSNNGKGLTKENNGNKQGNSNSVPQQGSNGHQQGNNGNQQGNNGNQQSNNGNQQGNNGNKQGNNGNQQGNNGNQQSNNGNQQGNNGNKQGNNGNQQGNNGNQQGNNGHQQGNNGHQQGNNGNQQGNNGNQQGNNGKQQGNNGRGPEKEDNENQQGNNGRGPEKENNGNHHGNNGRGPEKENNGHHHGNNGRGPEKETDENQQGNNGRGPQKEYILDIDVNIWSEDED
ncbi:anti-sigma factor domain-containing protein [Bacillus bombysepticus]|uniref:anti-sigma factor domain-containing protein n=1 Tax=Bacillus bombysepticus TaxID=658666 RepID=UPI00301662DC